MRSVECGMSKKRNGEARKRAALTRANVPLLEVLSDALDEDDDTLPCTVCAL